MNPSKNLTAFLLMIRRCEGTAGLSGYRTLFGGRLFNSYADHPNIRVPFRDTYSTAAGAYQILYRTWTPIKKALGLKDFTPANQDRAAAYLINQKGALQDVESGNFDKAVYKVRKVWASLPGAGYNQPEKTLAQARQFYKDGGGTIA
jgi:lysozyme